MFFSNLFDRRIDIDIGVAVERFLMREREAAGAEHENILVLETEIVEQNLAQVLDVARVIGRLGIIDQRRRRFIDPEGARVVLAR
jgi:hypothetical protein